MINKKWQGRKVTVVGLGIEGEDLARYFAGHGALVTVTDRKLEKALAPRIAALAGLPITFKLGTNNPADIDDADLVCVSQGVLPASPFVTHAREKDIPVASMTGLFLDNFPGTVVGITGSSGKTTTTALVDAIFKQAGRPHITGGNIGVGIMSQLDQATPDTWAVLEISHTQLVHTTRSPQVAALLRITPNHLDQFTWREYIALKKKIFSFQGPDDCAVFNADDRVTNEVRTDSKARKFLFSGQGDHGSEGAFLQDGTIYWRRGERAEAVLPAADVTMRGQHNVINVVGAAAIAAACGIEPEAVAAAVREFRAPPHRIEFVDEINGVKYYNDSIATTPERTVAALKSFDEKVVLLLGGRDKNLPLIELARTIPERCEAIICFGESGPILLDTFELLPVGAELVVTMEEALHAAQRFLKPGMVVLLSPACTSFDAYDNFEKRGEHFRELVRDLKQKAGD